VANEGWVLEADDGAGDDMVAMRGYTVKKKATEEIIISEPGNHVIAK